MSPRFRSSFAAPTGFVAAVTRIKPHVDAVHLPLSRTAVETAPREMPVQRQAA